MKQLYEWRNGVTWFQGTQPPTPIGNFTAKLVQRVTPRTGAESYVMDVESRHGHVVGINIGAHELDDATRIYKSICSAIGPVAVYPGGMEHLPAMIKDRAGRLEHVMGKSMGAAMDSGQRPF